MKFKKVTARFVAPDISAAEELICDIFFQFNLKGVVCEIPLEEPDEGFGTNTLPSPEHNAITGFLPLMDATDVQVQKIKKETSQLSGLQINVKVLTETVDENEWADAWKAYFEVTPVTERIIIKPDWKPYQAKDGECVIHLDPGMAFGTGTHPTTAMCLQFMDQYLQPGDSFLDIGTGSGILMIAAAKLGAGHLFGFDTDPLAVDIARQNMEKNQIPTDRFVLDCTTLDQTAPERYDLIAANIIAQVIVDILPDIALRMDRDTVAILSGIIKERLPGVKKALHQCDLICTEERFEDEWVALAVKKNQAP